MKRTRDDVLYPSRRERYGRSQGGMERDARGKAGRRLTMKDALSYVREVKDAFLDQPEKYDVFLEIMKDFNTQRINRARVVARAKELFEGYNRLIHGFNTFLPEGYEIAPDEPPVKKKPVTYKEAIGYMDKVKECLQNEEHIYESFNHILYLYRRGRKINRVYNDVARLFAGHPDLFEGFKRFLPEGFRHDEELNCTTTLNSRQLQMVDSQAKRLHRFGPQ